MSGSAKAPEPAGGREADGRRILITGGCGFIGCNLAAHYMGKGWEVIAYDDFSHPGADKNAAWLESLGGGKL
nr:NAD-dependent epimerase/dehydratase family protein [Anaerolineae bacterium]NIN95841.1 NAD-dependent epimerase/dehydratase family protein [Anaerolineae bacterium]